MCIIRGVNEDHANYVELYSSFLNDKKEPLWCSGYATRLVNQGLWGSIPSFSSLSYETLSKVLVPI